MYNVLDIARFIINYSNEIDNPISNLKLQKLLFYTQVYFLITKNQKCFKEKIIAWEIGPIIFEAYEEFERFGCLDIPKIRHYFTISNSLVKKEYYNNSIIKQKDKKLIIEVINLFKDYNATEITKLSQNQDVWKNAYSPVYDNEITEKNILEYFTN